MCKAFAALVVAVVAGTASAREFPAGTRVGWLEVGVFPAASINGDAVRFAPGGRIIDTRNLIVTPGSVRGAQRVRYQLDFQGNVRTAWILTAEEADAAASGAGK